MTKQPDCWFEITLPCLDRHGNCLQFYACPHDDGYLFTDRERTLADLEQSGRAADKKLRDTMISRLYSLGVCIKGRSLQICASDDNFALRIDTYIQAILTLNAQGGGQVFDTSDTSSTLCKSKVSRTFFCDIKHIE